MSAPLRLLFVAVSLSALVLATLYLLGADLEALFAQERLAAWLRARPVLGSVAALGLLTSDLFLPIPSATVVTALGIAFGTVHAALVGSVGLFGAGALGYGAARLGGRRLSAWIADDRELAALAGGFDRWGGLAVALTRTMPMVPEVMSVLAGLVGMDPRRYFVALAIGSVSASLLYAWLGTATQAQPLIGILASLVLPIAAWVAYERVLRRRSARNGGPHDERGGFQR